MLKVQKLIGPLNERTSLVPPTCTLMAEHTELTKQILLDQIKLRVQKLLHQEFSVVT